MYFGSGSLVVAVNVLVFVALLVMPLIYDRTVRLLTRRLRGSPRSDARSALPNAQSHHRVQTDNKKVKRLKCASNDRNIQNLENRLVEQSRRLNESEFALEYLRDEIEVAHGQAKRAAQNHETEKAKLQAAFDRSNSERARLAYQLAKMKQQGERTMPVKQVEGVMLHECFIDAECSGRGERTVLNQPLIETDEMKGCLPCPSAATVLNPAAQTDIKRALSPRRVVLVHGGAWPKTASSNPSAIAGRR